MGSRWDAHLNGYLVMGDRHDTLFQSSQFAYFTGHNQINNLFNNVQYAGNGADVGFAYQVFTQTPFKVFAGGYFFSPSQGNIGGGLAGLEYWFDSYFKVFAAYSYDNVRHSTGALGLGIEFGGTHVHRSDPDLEERMTDPVQRYLAELGHGSKIPSRIVNQFSGQVVVLNNIAFFSQPGARIVVLNNIAFFSQPGARIVVLNNISFFSQSGMPNNGGLGLTIANCTFENPCGPTDLTNTGAATLNALLPNTKMYFNGGSYNALNVPGGTLAVTLQPGQTIESRTADYTQLATGAARSTFNGAFILPGNNTLENIILLPTEATVDAGISSNDGSNLLISGSQIGSSTEAIHFRIAIWLAGETNTLIQNTNISSSSTSPSAFNDRVIGIQALDSSVTTLQNVNISLFSSTDAAAVNPIIMEGNVSAMIKNSNLVIMNTGAIALANSDIFIRANNNTVTVMDSTLTVTAGNPDSSVNNTVNGINVLGSSGNIVNLINTHVNVTNTAVGGIANALNNYGTGSNSITANYGTLAANGTFPAISNGPGITINGSVRYLNGSPVVGYRFLCRHSSICYLNGSRIDGSSHVVRY